MGTSSSNCGTLQLRCCNCSAASCMRNSTASDGSTDLWPPDATLDADSWSNLYHNPSERDARGMYECLANDSMCSRNANLPASSGKASCRCVLPNSTMASTTSKANSSSSPSKLNRSSGLFFSNSPATCVRNIPTSCIPREKSSWFSSLVFRLDPTHFRISQLLDLISARSCGFCMLIESGIDKKYPAALINPLAYIAPAGATSPYSAPLSSAVLTANIAFFLPYAS
mmetsp:Transcript_10825/g.30195  ORF Transcript_10825/g.30195 Transcript_10825/m.30195 type:complete len:227 (+) Transcript_10825:4484-5164(+)